MKEEIINKIAEIKEDILESEEYKLFMQLNKKIKKDDEVIALSFEIDQLNKKIEANPQNIGELQGFLTKKINDLNSLDLVKQYNNAFIKLNEVYSLINFEIIYPLNISLEKK